MNAHDIRGPVAITGSANGIGYAIALAFAKLGTPVAIIDLDETLARDTAAALAKETGIATCGVGSDVSNSEQSTKAHKEIESTLGPIAVLVNNAGIMARQKGWIEELPEADFDRMMDIHLRGSFVWSRLVMPSMRQAGYGRVINMSSVNGLAAVPHRLAYVTAKKAILGFTEALALDCARAGITVNAIAPGYVLTETLKERLERGMLDHDGFAERTPVGRWAQPDEIARVAIFLADRASDYITGATIAVDGGLHIRGDHGENIDISPFQ